jgi:GTP diphosphokinase / guanosine-3',5'-bis(diphosphate) 3'-diphosphatase
MTAKVAEQYAWKFHQGQFRKKNNLPYIVHPENVVNYLKGFGINDENTLSVAWLHDTLEDTTLSYEEIELVFGKSVAKNVYILTRNVDREKYKQRLKTAGRPAQLVKLVDTLDNVSTLDSLSPESIQRKIEDCEGFYIPLANKIFPEIGKQLENHINYYKR